MMVNNFTNFNKANNPLPLHSLDVKQITTYDVWNAGPCLGQAQQCGGIKLVNGISKFPHMYPILFQSYKYQWATTLYICYSNVT